MASESQWFIHFGPTSSFTSGYVGDGSGLYVNPVITGKYKRPEPEKYSLRIGPNAGDGDYYCHRSSPNASRYSTRWKPPGGYKEQIFSGSMDSLWDILYDPGTRYEEHRWGRYYSDGIYAYIVWFYTYTRNPRDSRGQVRWWKKVGESSTSSSTVYTLDLFDSGIIKGLTFEQWLNYYQSQLHAKPTNTQSFRAVRKVFSEQPGVESAVHDGLDAFLNFEELGELPRGYQLLAASAYLNQASRLPVATTNTLSNILELASAIISGVRGDFSSLTQLADPRKAWLAYRYSYTTSKLDFEEYRDLTSRLLAIANSGVVTSHGYASSGGTTCKCTCHYNPSSLLPSDLKSFLRQYGLRLSLVNAWDMIPYSFIVDWFLHISKFLQDLDDRDNMLTLSPTDVWYSFKNFENQSNGYYFRIRSGPYYNAPFVGPSSASVKTTLMRVADTVSLFT